MADITEPTEPTEPTAAEPVGGDGGDGVLARRRARRRRRRRRAVVTVVVLALVAGGAGTAWAVHGSGGPGYRLATVGHGSVAQTVGADGTLAAHRTATASFAASGTVATVPVAVGDTVTAGQTLATLDPTSLDAAVTAAQAEVARAQQKLADDEDAQASGTASTATSTSTSTTSTSSTSSTSTTGTANFVETAAVTPTRSGGSGLAAAQQRVVAAQRALDKAVAAQDAAVRTLVTACAASADAKASTVPATAGRDATLSGAGGSAPVVVSLLTAGGDLATTTSANPQRLAADGTWTFTGLTAGTAYTVSLTRTAAIDSASCTAAVGDAGSGQRAVDTATSALDTALAALATALGAASSSGSGSTGATTGRTGSGTTTGGTTGGATRGSTGSSGSTRSSGSTGSTGSTGSVGSTGSTGTAGSTGGTVTAEQIAADAKAIDAAEADLAVARDDRGHAALTAPIAGTVAAVAVTKGDTVSAGSTSATVTVVGPGTLSVDLSIGIADIDLVSVGQGAAVTVDGHTGTLPARVTYVGATNTADSTGSSSAYTVTVRLTRTYASLYDGMGADVAIRVGSASGALTVPVSALHTTGTRHTVQVYSGGRVTDTAVTVGVVGDSLAQVKSGLRAGQRVVLADLGAAVPSSTTTSRRGGSGLGGLGTGTRGGFGGGTGGAGGAGGAGGGGFGGPR